MSDWKKRVDEARQKYGEYEDRTDSLLTRLVSSRATFLIVMVVLIIVAWFWLT